MTCFMQVIEEENPRSLLLPSVTLGFPLTHPTVGQRRSALTVLRISA